MVSDLTERLRTYAADEPEWTSGHKVMTEAADEIDRLTAALAAAKRERDEAVARANQVGEHTAKLMTAVGGAYVDALKEKP